VLQRLNDALQVVLKKPEVRTRMGALGFEPLPGPPAALSTHMQAVQDAWARVVRERRISTD
jgi:tripartite-type tricarboxylate transporter receptor subunit TctC